MGWHLAHERLPADTEQPHAVADPLDRAAIEEVPVGTRGSALVVRVGQGETGWTVRPGTTLRHDGCRRTGDRSGQQRPRMPDRTGERSLAVGMDVFGRAPTTEAGEYFRNSGTWWYPLAEYCCEVALGSSCEHVLLGMRGH